MTGRLDPADLARGVRICRRGFAHVLDGTTGMNWFSSPLDMPGSQVAAPGAL
jgi:hypothetical protein